jgi:hypothetical protein
MGSGAELLRRILTRPAVEKVKLRWLEVEPWCATMRRWITSGPRCVEKIEIYLKKDVGGFRKSPGNIEDPSLVNSRLAS